MTKSKILSEQFNFLNLNLIDLLRLMDPTDKSKYIDLLFRLLIKSNLDKTMSHQSNGEEITHLFEERFNIPKNKIDSLNPYEKQFFAQMLNVLINSEDYRIIKDFVELNERKLINVDISNIKTITELSNHVTLGEFKKMSKDSENSVQILIRNDKWLVLRPLSFESSLKYGRGTKWCTASSDSYNFYRYSNNGILIYIVNLETGNKTGFFHNVGDDHETSFWNVIDQRVDSFETDLDSEVINVLKKEIKENRVSNYSLFSEVEKNKHELTIKTIRIEPIVENYETEELDLEPLQEEISGRITFNSGIVPTTMGTNTITNGTTTTTAIYDGTTWMTNTTIDFVERA